MRARGHFCFGRGCAGYSTNVTLYEVRTRAEISFRLFEMDLPHFIPLKKFLREKLDISFANVVNPGRQKL
jgi:hypothetical protein